MTHHQIDQIIDQHWPRRSRNKQQQQKMFCICFHKWITIYYTIVTSYSCQWFWNLYAQLRLFAHQWLTYTRVFGLFIVPLTMKHVNTFVNFVLCWSFYLHTHTRVDLNWMTCLLILLKPHHCNAFSFSLYVFICLIDKRQYDDGGDDIVDQMVFFFFYQKLLLLTVFIAAVMQLLGISAKWQTEMAHFIMIHMGNLTKL